MKRKLLLPFLLLSSYLSFSQAKIDVDKNPTIDILQYDTAEIKKNLATLRLKEGEYIFKAGKGITFDGEVTEIVRNMKGEHVNFDIVLSTLNTPLGKFNYSNLAWMFCQDARLLDTKLDYNIPYEKILPPLEEFLQYLTGETSGKLDSVDFVNAYDKLKNLQHLKDNNEVLQMGVDMSLFSKQAEDKRFFGRNLDEVLHNMFSYEGLPTGHYTLRTNLQGRETLDVVYTNFNDTVYGTMFEIPVQSQSIYIKDPVNGDSLYVKEMNLNNKESANFIENKPFLVLETLRLAKEIYYLEKTGYYPSNEEGSLSKFLSKDFQKFFIDNVGHPNKFSEPMYFVGKFLELTGRLEALKSNEENKNNQ